MATLASQPSPSHGAIPTLRKKVKCIVYRVSSPAPPAARRCKHARSSESLPASCLRLYHIAPLFVRSVPVFRRCPPPFFINLVHHLVPFSGRSTNRLKRLLPSSQPLFLYTESIDLVCTVMKYVPCERDMRTERLCGDTVIHKQAFCEAFCLLCIRQSSLF